MNTFFTEDSNADPNLNGSTNYFDNDEWYSLAMNEGN